MIDLWYLDIRLRHMLLYIYAIVYDSPHIFVFFMGI